MEYVVTFQDGSSGYLHHSGVKGMKWGVRHDRMQEAGMRYLKRSEKADRRYLAEKMAMQRHIERRNNRVYNKIRASYHEKKMNKFERKKDRYAHFKLEQKLRDHQAKKYSKHFDKYIKYTVGTVNERRFMQAQDIRRKNRKIKAMYVASAISSDYAKKPIKKVTESDKARIRAYLSSDPVKVQGIYQ